MNLPTLAAAKPYIYAVAALLLLGAFVETYRFGYKNAKLSDDAQQAHDSALVQKVHDDVLNTTATAIAGIQVHNQTIQQKAIETIREVPVYQDCHNTPDVKALIEAARAPQ